MDTKYFYFNSCAVIPPINQTLPILDSHLTCLIKSQILTFIQKSAKVADCVDIEKNAFRSF